MSTLHLIDRAEISCRWISLVLIYIIKKRVFDQWGPLRRSCSLRVKFLFHDRLILNFTYIYAKTHSKTISSAVLSKCSIFWKWKSCFRTNFWKIHLKHFNAIFSFLVKTLLVQSQRKVRSHFFKYSFRYPKKYKFLFFIFRLKFLFQKKKISEQIWQNKRVLLSTRSSTFWDSFVQIG